MRWSAASRPRASVSRPHKPGGLFVPVRATLRGRTRWSVLDERGIPEVPRGPSGFALAPIEGVEGPNLITNAGLDNAAVRSVRTAATGTTWRGHLAVGAGSTAPAVTDTALDSEVERASSIGSYTAPAAVYELDTTDNVWRATIPVLRVVTMTATRNLTEYAFFPGATGVNANIRELLRDGGGTPITVSLLTGKSIRVDHDLIIEIPAPAAGHSGSINVDHYDATDTLVSTTAYSIVHGGHVQGTTVQDPFLYGPFGGWDPATNSVHGVRGFNTSFAYARVNAFASEDRIPATGASLSGAGAWEAYVVGTYERTYRMTVPVGSGNEAWYGYYTSTNVTTGSAGWIRSGWMVLFDGPATYTKQETDTLRVGYVSSWARA